MKLFVLLLGVVICAVCLVMLVRPQVMVGLADKVFNGRLIYLAALGRLLLGALLIAAAPSVAYSFAVEVLGWLFVLGGLLLVTIPIEVWQRLAKWAVSLPALAIRGAAVFAFAFGAFFVYAASV